MTKQKHHPDCGEVGETGEHGDLGTNAIDHPERLGSAQPPAKKPRKPRAKKAAEVKTEEGKAEE